MLYIYCNKNADIYKNKINVLVHNQPTEKVMIQYVSKYIDISRHLYNMEASACNKYSHAYINVVEQDGNPSIDMFVYVSAINTGIDYLKSLKSVIPLLNSANKYSAIAKAESMSLTSINEAIKYLEDYFFSVTGEVFPNDFVKKIDLVIRLMERKLFAKSNPEEASNQEGFPHFYTIYYSCDGCEQLKYGKLKLDFEGSTLESKSFIIEDIYGNSQAVFDNLKKQRFLSFYDHVASELQTIISVRILWNEQTIIFVDWDRLYAIDGKSLDYFINSHKAGLISDKVLINSICHSSYEDIIADEFEETLFKPIAKAESVMPGVAVGKIITGKEDVSELKKHINGYILVKEELFPDDLEYINLADGILTRSGSSTSHPALIAKQLGKIYLFNCTKLLFKDNQVIIGNVNVHSGDTISLDGKNGYIYNTFLAKKEKSRKDDYFEYITRIVNKYTPFKVLTNTESPHNYFLAKKFGSSGVGLYRSEYMNPQETIRKYITGILIINDYNIRSIILKRLENLWHDELLSFLNVSTKDTFTFRILDYPSDELLFNIENIVQYLSDEYKIPKSELIANANIIKEKVGSLGARGIRMLLMHPELLESQIKTLFTVINEIDRETRPSLRIMIPVVAATFEVISTKQVIERISKEFDCVEYYFGIMIETPRAALIIKELVHYIDFISFGTNDLTQLLWGMSREDYAPIINFYNKKGFMTYNPFDTLDPEAVIPLIKQVIDVVKKGNPKINISICGNQAFSSIDRLIDLGIDSISISYKDTPFALLRGAKLFLNE